MLHCFKGDLFITNMSMLVDIIVVSVSTCMITEVRFHNGTLMGVLLCSAVFVPTATLACPMCGLVGGLRLCSAHTTLVLVCSYDNVTIDFFIVGGCCSGVPGRLRRTTEVSNYACFRA